MILEQESHVLVIGKDWANLVPMQWVKELHQWEQDHPHTFWDHVKEEHPTHTFYYVYKKPA